MATYKNAAYLTQDTDVCFDVFSSPGETVHESGIYRCEGCGREIVSEVGKTFPPQNHHQHTVAEGHIRWRLIVCRQHE